MYNSLLLAAKFFEDQPCDNGYFATVGGVSLRELNAMEVLFLTLTKHRISVDGSDFDKYSKVVEANNEKPAVYVKEVVINTSEVTPEPLRMHMGSAISVATR